MIVRMFTQSVNTEKIDFENHKENMFLATDSRIFTERTLIICEKSVHPE
jgi:hypothetical protein